MEDENERTVSGLNMQPLQDENGCMKTVSSEVCMEADVTITPSVTSGTPVVSCVEEPVVGTCASLGFTPSETGSCTFTFSQVLCVNIPLTFDADAYATPGDVACGSAFNQPNCENGNGNGPGCTRTRGYYANNEEETLQLLELAGGQIILGIDDQGFSLTVTASNIDAVVSGNIPEAPSPQYQQLYTQLLTANLNVLSGAGCAFATNAIMTANTFLANPTQNDPLASQLQEDLALYNEGNAEGCPDHCNNNS